MLSDQITNILFLINLMIFCRDMGDYGLAIRRGFHDHKWVFFIVIKE
jgi:hypothetical protein